MIKVNNKNQLVKIVKLIEWCLNKVCLMKTNYSNSKY